VLEWFLNRRELLECAEGAGLSLVREFMMLDSTPARGVPEQARYRGFLFEPGTSRTPSPTWRNSERSAARSRKVERNDQSV
jgi:hypothetical protein